MHTRLAWRSSMRLNCGPTLEERAKARHYRKMEWHAYFALLPRRIGQQCVWLEAIERKGKRHVFDTRHGITSYWTFEYRLPPTGAAE